MKIEIKKENETLVIALEGRLDTNTAPEMEKELEAYYNKESFHIILNFEKLDFVSSAGLRVLLLMQKKANALKGKLVIEHVKPEIQEVFTMTGFSEILTII